MSKNNILFDKFCECGCGQKLRKQKNGKLLRFIRGHQFKVLEKHPRYKSEIHNLQLVACACGCGKRLKPKWNSHKKSFTKYIHGHNKQWTSKNNPHHSKKAAEKWRNTVEKNKSFENRKNRTRTRKEMRYCAICNKSFQIWPNSTRKTCGEKKCWYILYSKISKETRFCIICGKSFQNYVKKGRKTCSEKCTNILRSQITKSQNRKLLTPKKRKICPICKQPYQVNSNASQIRQKKTCDTKCSYILRSQNRQRENNPKWKGPISKKYCIICKKELNRHQILQKINCCSLKCRGMKMKGENNPSWRGGISREPYAFDFNKELKELVRKRDNYKCQLCGAPQEEFTKKLPIHHTNYDKKDSNPDRLITLCISCNFKVNTNRDYWQKYFEKLLESNFSNLKEN